MKHIRHFILAVQFLTRIPITKRSMPCEPSDFKGAMAFFVSIGLLIGGLQYGAYVVMAELANPLVGALVSTVVGVWVTGGLHLDGLADIWDGFGANASRERTIEIMKDSRVGAFGVIAIVLDLLVHFVGIYSLAHVPLVIIWVPMCAKLGVCFMCYIGKNIKAGLGALWIQNIGLMRLLINGCVAAFVGWLIMPSVVVVGGVVVTLGITYGLKHKFTAKLGGLNGDCLGATGQLIEWGIILYLIIML